MYYNSGMVLLWTLISVLFLLLAICFVVMRFAALEIERRQEAVIEGLWSRRNRIPLLLEVVARAEGEHGPKSDALLHANLRSHIIDLRDKLASAAFTLPEQIEMEKQMSDLIATVFRLDQEYSFLKQDLLFISLKKEFEEIVEKIRIEINDYNFSFQKLANYYRLPFLKIFELIYRIGRKQPLQLL